MALTIAEKELEVSEYANPTLLQVAVSATDNDKVQNDSSNCGTDIVTKASDVHSNDETNCSDRLFNDLEFQTDKTNFIDTGMHFNGHTNLLNQKEKSKREIFVGELLGVSSEPSSNDSSCVNSPTFSNINASQINFPSTKNMNLLIKEYESLKVDYQSLQTDYQNSLEREKDLCGRLQEYGGQDDESFNSLTNINNELRTELDKVLEELKKSKVENKRLQEILSEKQQRSDGIGEKVDKIEDIVKLERFVSELEKESKVLEEERDNAKEKLAAHDMAAKRAITALQKEMTLRVDQATKMYDEATKEKDSLILKAARLEEIIDNQKTKNESMDKKTTDYKKEAERLKTLLKQKDIDLAKLQTLTNEKDEEIKKYKDELERQKDEDSSQNMKVKWAQNKLKQELESHKETKMKLTQAHAKIDEIREEGEQIRAACQEMIRKYQDSEEMRSNQLDMQLKERDSAIKIHEHEIAVQDEMHRMRTQELEALKGEHRKALNEIAQLKTNISLLEGRVSNYTIKNADLEKKLEILLKREEEANVTDKLLHDANKELKSYRDQVNYFIELEESLRQQLLDAESEAKDCKQKETELLSFTEKLTENNAHWKSKAFDMQSKAEDLNIELEELKKLMSNFDVEKKQQGDRFRKEREEYENGLEELVTQLEQKRKLVEELTMNLEEAQDEIKVQKRKNTSTIKDLQRQLLHSKKRLEQLEEGLSNSQESLPIKSRTSSNSSLDRLSNDSASQTASSLPATAPTVIPNQNAKTTAYTNFGDYSIVQPSRQSRGHSGGEIEVDKAVLVDRICKLQKAHAKKNEKMEFMEEHINSLIEEMKKKNKVVQYYVIREESGMLASNKFDKNKAEMSRKGGIMASVYSSRVSDKDMTLELSLEINRKLQAVLEDTLLKNMTLKESINTLGIEIARLQDNQKTVRR